MSGWLSGRAAASQARSSQKATSPPVSASFLVPRVPEVDRMTKALKVEVWLKDRDSYERKGCNQKPDCEHCDSLYVVSPIVPTQDQNKPSRGPLLRQ